MTRPDAATVWIDLDAGNARFAAGTQQRFDQHPARRAALADGQAPIATVLGCSDSRVPPELVFDQGLGDLFTVRNAGQVADAAAIASIEYAVAALGVPLVLVLAHERCGAVAAAAHPSPSTPPHIAAHVGAIRPAVTRAGEGADDDAVGRAHLELTMAGLLRDSELVSAAIADGSVALVGARYSLMSGRVERIAAVGVV